MKIYITLPYSTADNQHVGELLHESAPLERLPAAAAHFRVERRILILHVALHPVFRRLWGEISNAYMVITYTCSYIGLWSYATSKAHCKTRVLSCSSHSPTTEVQITKVEERLAKLCLGYHGYEPI